MPFSLMNRFNKTESSIRVTEENLVFETVLSGSYYWFECGGVAQLLGRQISDQGVPGSNPGRSTFRCGLEQVTFTLLGTG